MSEGRLDEYRLDGPKVQFLSLREAGCGHTTLARMLFSGVSDVSLFQSLSLYISDADRRSKAHCMSFGLIVVDQGAMTFYE